MASTLQQAVHPGKKFSGTVIGVHHDPGVVHRCHLMDVMGSHAGAFYSRLLIGIVQPFSCTESGSTVGKLNDHRRVDLSGRL